MPECFDFCSNLEDSEHHPIEKKPPKSSFATGEADLESGGFEIQFSGAEILQNLNQRQCMTKGFPPLGEPSPIGS